MKAHSQLLFLLFFLCLGVSAHAEMMLWDRDGLNQYCKQVYRQKQWCQTGEGWVNGGETEIIKVSFKACNCLEVADARRAFVPEIEKAIDMIQTKQRASTIKKIGRSFTHKDLCYTLFFYDKFGKCHPEPYLDYMMFVFGNILYMTKAGEIHRESFEDAIRILEEESIACSNELSSYHDCTP
jgi:hypothetical protein